MKNFITAANELKQKLLNAIQKELPAGNGQLTIINTATVIKITHKHISQLKASMDDFSIKAASPFKNSEEEIRFFKEIKPVFLSTLFYYSAVYEILLKCPAGSTKSCQSFWENEMGRLHDWLMSNREFYAYYRNGDKCLDNVFFRRNTIEAKLAMGYSAFTPDENFSTGYDERLARIMAYEQLLSCIEKELAKPTDCAGSQPAKTASPKTILWTESKTALVELIYALHYSGAFNNGAAAVKDIAGFFEKNFGISLGDYYRTYIQIRMRKNGFTPFIDTMKSRMDIKIQDSFAN